MFPNESDNISMCAASVAVIVVGLNGKAWGLFIMEGTKSFLNLTKGFEIDVFADNIAKVEALLKTVDA